MTNVDGAVRLVLDARQGSGKPMAIMLAGHNGSGKSTLWYQRLAPIVQIPLVNADRMMLSILPEERPLPDWAIQVRDTDESWMRVAQKGVEAFVVQAMAQNVPFAMETVFSYWEEKADGTVASKIDLIRQLQDAGFFVVLLFVGLTSAALSIARVETRVRSGGHAVATQKLVDRFPRTQKAICAASSIADAALLFDNSLSEDAAFSVCLVRLSDGVLYDVRDALDGTPGHLAWLSTVAPRETAHR